MNDDLNDIGIYACEHCGEDTWDKGVITETGTLCLSCYKKDQDERAQRLIKYGEITKDELDRQLRRMLESGT